ncbi:MAG TPA: 30S ribosomal protein S12 methylthiotransferase RimO [Fibrobacteria bacterium]|nr:30S ribosomal protein S12 methylthiotransferase RimO [Fibrobacteria bacterium]
MPARKPTKRPDASAPADPAVIPSPFGDKKVRLLNLGCSKNQVDSENILGEFGRAGFTRAKDGEDPSVTVINTCGFIEAAKEESIQEILAAVGNRVQGEKLVVAGCLAQRYMEDLKKDIPEVDLYIGTYREGELLERLGLNSTLPSDCKVGAAPRSLMGEEPHHAFLKIAEGCNRICGFCAIPGMRGKQKSRAIADIVAEAQQLQSWGIKEVSLIAQDLTFFGREKNGKETLELLLRALIKETDIPWFRMMYGYPAFLTDGLIDVMATEKRICKYMDIPIQHASAPMLKAMRRNYSAEQLREGLLKLRNAVPGIALRSTALLGYPGETEKDVDDLTAFLEEIRFRHLGCFAYSDEEGTHAFDLQPKVPQDVIEARVDRVMTLQRQISLEHNQDRIGETVTVIIDSEAEGQDHHFVGRTEGDAPEADNTVLIFGSPELPGGMDADAGTFRKVLITDAREYDLEGKLLPIEAA